MSKNHDLVINRSLIGISLALSSASALIYEITTTQTLFFYFIESSYSLSIVLGAFLTGLGLGSFGMHTYLEKLPNKKAYIFGIFQLIISIYGFFILTNLPSIIPRISTFGILLSSFLVILIPTVFLGAIFPLSVALFRSSTREISGLVYAIDLVGAVLGSLLVGFILIPQYGIVLAVIAGSLLNLISAAIVLPRYLKLLPLALAIIFVVTIQMGYIKLFPVINVSRLPSDIDSKDFQFHRNSPMGTVVVAHDTLYINGKEQCSLLYESDASEIKIADYTVKPLQNTSPNLNILNIGLGCGLTVNRLLEFPQVHLDVVEINPVVVEANKTFTNTFDRNFNLIIDDGFNYLKRTPRKYHGIVVDIEDPKVIHSSALYTLEAFGAAKSRLEDGGILALWTYEPPVWIKPAFIRRYLDIIYFTMKEHFKYVYWYPRVFLATDRKLDAQEYIPETSYETNTLNHNTISSVFNWFELPSDVH